MPFSDATPCPGHIVSLAHVDAIGLRYSVTLQPAISNAAAIAVINLVLECMVCSRMAWNNARILRKGKKIYHTVSP